MTEHTTSTMDCTDIKALLSALLDDRVDAATRHRAERHMADCDDCRRIMDEAEAAEALMAADAAAAPQAPALPAGFEAAVLEQTAWAPRGSRWSAWLGWLAAAAGVMLAVTIWVVDAPRESGALGPQQGGQLALGQNAAAGTAAGQPPVLGPPVDTQPARPDLLPQAALAVRTTPASDPPGPRRVDLETLDSAALALGLLRQADLDDFTDVERIRRTIAYDRLVPRLAEARSRMPHDDHAAIFAAESILYRIVNGPLSLDDARRLQADLARLDLLERLGRMTSRLTPVPAL